MHKNILFTLLFIFTFLTGKASIFLTAKEKAYLFHVVKQSKVLDRNVGHLFTYYGDTILTNKYQFDLDAMEVLIANKPSLLEINYDELKFAQAGILSECATKMALWKLHKELKNAENSNLDEFPMLESIVKELENTLPERLTRTRTNKKVVPKKALELLHPNLSMHERIEMVHKIEKLTLREKKMTLDAIINSIANESQRQSLILFELLGGKASQFKTNLLAAGEGSKTNGLLDSNEKNEHGNPDKKQPKGIGLFTYRTHIVKDDRNRDNIGVKQDPTLLFKNIVPSKKSSIHLSIWGFNAYFQTTVVIKKEGKSYLLFGNKESKELSPDSSFTHGKTYFQHIETLEREKIKVLDEKINGEEGLIKRIAFYKRKIIETTEIVNDIEYKLRKYQMDNNRKKYTAQKEKFIHHSNILETYKSKRNKSEIELIKKEKELEWYQDYVYNMKANLGSNIIPSAQRGDIFYFEDGAIFNAFTQNFYFPSGTSEQFTVRLISIGTKPLSKNVDEVQLFVGVTEKPEQQRESFSLELQDLFGPDQFLIDKIEIENKGELSKIAQYLSGSKAGLNLRLKGSGIGIKENGIIIQSEDVSQLDKYPKNNRDKEGFKENRVSFVNVFADGNVHVQINSFTDKVKSSLRNTNPEVDTLMMKIGINRTNSLLSSLRTFNILEHLLSELGMQSIEDAAFKPHLANGLKSKLTINLEKAIVYCEGKKITYQQYLKIKEWQLNHKK